MTPPTYPRCSLLGSMLLASALAFAQAGAPSSPAAKPLTVENTRGYGQLDRDLVIDTKGLSSHET